MLQEGIFKLTCCVKSSFSPRFEYRGLFFGYLATAKFKNVFVKFWRFAIVFEGILCNSRGFDDAILQIKHGHHVSDTIINCFGE